MLHDLENYYLAVEKQLAKPRPMRQAVAEPSMYTMQYFLPATFMVDRFDLCVTQLRLTYIALRLREFHCANNKYPGSLLAAGIKDPVASDPYSNRPFIFRSSEIEYQLYSVGIDGQDNNGRTADAANPNSQGDYGIRSQYLPRAGRRPGRFRGPVPHMGKLVHN